MRTWCCAPDWPALRPGDRLGRGGGWYDRVLPLSDPGATVMLLLNDDEVMDSLPTGPLDRRVDAILTPTRRIGLRRSRVSDASDRRVGVWFWWPGAVSIVVMAEVLTVTGLLDGHVGLDVECLDRLYLNGYVPKLQVSGQVAGFMTGHLGYPIPSPAIMEKIGTRFRRAVNAFATAHQIPVVQFDQGRP